MIFLDPDGKRRIPSRSDCRVDFEVARADGVLQCRMRDDLLVHRLHTLRRSFGRTAAARKLKLLEKLEHAGAPSSHELELLHATLDFLRAYPDDARVLRACQRAVTRLRSWVEKSPRLARSARLENSGLPGTRNSYAYSYATLAALVRRFPRSIDIDWDELGDDERLTSTLELLLSGVENECMEDVPMGWGEWVRTVRPRRATTDLAFLLSLFERSTLSPLERANLYDSLSLPIRYRLEAPGSGRCEVELPVARIAYQKRDVPRERFALAPHIRQTLPRQRALGLSAGRELLDVARRALTSRNLEIHPLLYANPRDVILFTAHRGVQVALSGVLPEHRGALAALYFFMVLKNGVPVAYGPASPFLGSCEMGINLFPEFRGGEIRYIYSQVMRLLHHVLAVDYFYLTSYGMGEGNEDAIRSGAFWFYRRMGFSASNPRVEALARSEEERMRAEPGYRSNVRMLRRLSNTEAYLDLSNGRCTRFPFGRLGLAVSRFVARRFDGDRDVATHRCTRDVLRLLGSSLAHWTVDEQRALRAMSLVLSMLRGVSGWSAAEKSALERLIRGKAARSEARACVGMKKHRPFASGILSLVPVASETQE